MQGPLVTDGVCPQDGMPSVSSINRIVRNKVVERVCKSEYEDLEPLLDTKHKLAPSSYSINRILGQHAHLSPAPALKRKWSEDAKAAADSGGKREYVGQYTSGQPAPAMEIKWDQDPPHLLLKPALAPPHYSSVSPLPPVSASLFESINTIQYPGRPAPPPPGLDPALGQLTPMSLLEEKSQINSANKDSSFNSGTFLQSINQVQIFLNFYLLHSRKNILNSKIFAGTETGSYTASSTGPVYATKSEGSGSPGSVCQYVSVSELSPAPASPDTAASVPAHMEAMLTTL